MITVCSSLAHSFKTIARRKPVDVQVFPLCTVQTLRSGRGGKDGVWFTCCVEGRDTEIYELWTFAEDGTREVHPFAQVQISDNFTGETFHTHFLMQKQFEFLSWVSDPSMEVFNGSMLLDHFAKLELLSNVRK